MTNDDLDREIYERELQEAREREMAREAAYELFQLDWDRAEAEQAAQADLDRQMADLERAEDT